jgi:hypothetical protein
VPDAECKGSLDPSVLWIPRGAGWQNTAPGMVVEVIYTLCRERAGRHPGVTHMQERAGRTTRMQCFSSHLPPSIAIGLADDPNIGVP